MKNRKSIFLLPILFSLTGCIFINPSPDNPPVDETIHVESITLNHSSLEMYVGDSEILTYEINPTNAKNKQVEWKSSDETVATIYGGELKALSKGTATITITSLDNGVSNGCYVTVLEKPVTPPEPDDDFDESLWDMNQSGLRNGNKSLNFYNFNDFHGAVEYSQELSEPGINYLSSYLKDVKSKNSNSFVLTSSGDMWQGSADSNITRGRLVTDWMNILKFDAMCIGNHEFDWTIDTIKSNMKLSNFPIISCNIVDKTTYKPVDWVQPYTTITRNGVRIGIIGAIGRGQTADILATNVKDLTFVNPTDYIVKYSEELRKKGADIVMLLYHCSCEAISSEINSLDLVFTGHNHSGENEMMGANYNVPVVEAWSNGKDIGHITLTYNFTNETVSYASGEILDTRFVNEDYSEDSETKTMYQKYLDEEISIIKNEKVGYAPNGISKSLIPDLYNKYAYKLFKDEYDKQDNYEIFAVETNGARSSIPSGTFTYGDIYKALPFDNYLTLVKISKDNIRKKLSTYSNAKYYIPSSNTYVYGSSFADYATGTGYVYMLIIDYISLSSTSYLTIEEYYTDEICLPRNIFKKYVAEDYPLR